MKSHQGPSLEAGDSVILNGSALAGFATVKVEHVYKDEGFFDTGGAFWRTEEIFSVQPKGAGALVAPVREVEEPSPI